jgi:glucan 1,3-beta-glucosidase
MSQEKDTAQKGVYMEDGSGGMLGDVIFHGGRYGER